MLLVISSHSTTYGDPQKRFLTVHDATPLDGLIKYMEDYSKMYDRTGWSLFKLITLNNQSQNIIFE